MTAAFKLPVAHEHRDTRECIYRLVTKSIPGLSIAVFNAELRLMSSTGPWPVPSDLPLEGVPIELALPHPDNNFVELFQEALRGRHVTFDYVYAARTFYFDVVPVHNEDGGIVAGMAVCRDVTAERAREQALRTAAWTDIVTGLKSRAGFLVDTAELRTQNGIAILVLDLDDFKYVNDTYGHPVGDVVLRTTADRIAVCLRKADHAARFGGDEFVILLTNVRDAKEAEAVSERILRVLREPIYVPDHGPINITASIGIAVGTQGGDFENTYKRADTALYNVKRVGKDGALGDL